MTSVEQHYGGSGVSPGEWSGGPSDIEGKATRVGASECGQRTSFNRTREAGHLDEIQGVVANTLELFRSRSACLRMEPRGRERHRWANREVETSGSE